MELGVSVLSIKDNFKENIKKLDACNFDYFHIDIMDGEFVENSTWNIDEVKEFTSNLNHPLDVHMMVSDVSKYIDDFSTIKPKFITFHYEATDNHKYYIDKIHSYGVKAGIAINPDTDINLITHLLNDVDLVLVMSVFPGYGGQKFIKDVVSKIQILKKLQKNYNFFIEVDGGITDETIKFCDTDIVVVGSFITGGNYEHQINALNMKSLNL